MTPTDPNDNFRTDGPATDYSVPYVSPFTGEVHYGGDQLTLTEEDERALDEAEEKARRDRAAEWNAKSAVRVLARHFSRSKEQSDVSSYSVRPDRDSRNEPDQQSYGIKQKSH